jgi:prepilin-type N-terminal cleavage/methylation domain-containing protein
MKLIKKDHGFTLIEVLVVIVIFAIIITAVYNAYFTSSETILFNREKLEIQRTQDVLNRWIGRYVRQANEIDTTVTGELKLLYNTSDKIVFGLNGDSFAYYSINDGNNRIISDLKLQNLIFNIENDVLKMSATIKSNDSNKTYSFVNVFNPRLPNVNLVSP